MSKKSFLKFLFFFLIISFLGFGQFVLACAEGQTRPGDPCGTQTCDKDCYEKEIDFGIEIITITVCDWGSCESDGQTQDCGACGVQECQSGSTSCSWDDCDETRKPSTEKTDDWTEYRCQEEGCGNQYIEKRKAYQDYTRSVSCLGEGNWKKGTWKKDGSPYYGTPSTIEQCDLGWQLCSGSTDWSTDSRSCDCAGTCLEAPENPRYYNNPNYPTPPPESYEAEKYEPEESEDSNNIFLPVKLDWDNVKAWKNGWQEEDEVLKECSEDCFQSYLIEINNTATGNFSKALTQDSKYNPTQNQGACFLKSGTTHNWNVSACCNADGTNCSSKSEWDFTTNSAPEPVLPADPDWTGLNKANTSLPVSLEWCPVNEAKSYRIRTYYLENEEERCHPWLVGEAGECVGRAVKKEEGILSSAFNDSKIGLFAKDNHYAWQVASCFLSDGSECDDFGQKWHFQTSEKYVLSKPSLISPGNDEQGKNAVALPVTLEWRAELGVYSFRYEINGVESKTSEPILALDYPELNLNTFYKWKIQPCWDEKSEKCEQDTWSNEWIFKTTGAPPNLISPESDTSNIPIPIKLDWESVSGAKSYKYWVYSGEKLIANNIVENSSILIKYDPTSKEPRQKTNYSWQVATCADEKGEICGPLTDPWEFTTFKLSSPSSLFPEDDETIFTYQMPETFSWDPVQGARFYKYIINYTSKSPDEVGDCPLGSIDGDIVDSTSVLVSLNCLGDYQWQIQACLDEECNEAGDQNNLGFTFAQSAETCKPSLVPCGRDCDVPPEITPWNERDACEFKHLFILLKSIIDFLLWRVTLIILLLLIIATAIIFYFSIGAPVMIIDIKGVWRAAGKGYAIIFLSWMIINLVLNILGYQVGIFGNWWQINL